KLDSPSSASIVSATALRGSPHHCATVGSLKISSSVASSPGWTGRRTTRLPGSSGGEVDPDRPQALVERVEGELQDLALGMPELGDVGGVWRVERARDQGKALDQRLLDQGRIAVGVLAHRVAQHLDAEADVTRLVSRDRGEAAVEAAFGEALLAHRLQLEALAGERDRGLDDDVVERHTLDERVEVLGIARQPLGGGGQAVIEEAVVTLVGLGPDLLEQLRHVARVGAGDVAPPLLEEDGVPGLVDHLGRQEDLDLGGRRGPDEGGEGGGDALLAVEEETVRPQRRLLLELGGLEPVLAVEAEVDVADRPLLRLPAPVEVHVAGHVLDPAVDEGKDVVDPDVPQLFEAGAADAVEVYS